MWALHNPCGGIEQRRKPHELSTDSQFGRPSHVIHCPMPPQFFFFKPPTVQRGGGSSRPTLMLLRLLPVTAAALTCRAACPTEAVSSPGVVLLRLIFVEASVRPNQVRSIRSQPALLAPQLLRCIQGWWRRERGTGLCRGCVI